MHDARKSAALIAGIGCQQWAPHAVDVLRALYDSYLYAPEAFKAEYAGSTEFILALIESSTPEDIVNVGPEQNVYGTSLLHYAAGCGCIEVCHVLLERCASLNFQEDGNGQTPLLWAAKHGMLRIAEILLHYGADPHHRDTKGFSALHLAAALGYRHMCLMLLDRPGGRRGINERCIRGWSPLHMASHKGSLAICQALVEHGGADILATTAEQELTALHIAVMQGHSDIAKYFADLDADLFLALDASGKSALDLARKHGHSDIAAMMKEPSDSYRNMVGSWLSLLDLGEVDTRHHHPSSVQLYLSTPTVQFVGHKFLTLCCHVVDLEYRLVEYILEVRCCNGPFGSAPTKIYFARSREQRKQDEVTFNIPRSRSAGVAVWALGNTYRFRIIGRCDRCPSLPKTFQQVNSEWSPPTMLQNHKRSIVNSTFL